MFENITPELIFKTVDQQQIMFNLINHSSIGKRNPCLNPFRPDTTPKCYLEWFGNKLLFIDFAWSVQTHSTIIDLWCIRNQVSYSKAIIDIYHSNIGNQSFRTTQPIKKKGDTPMFVESRNWSNDDRLYWEGKYDFTIYELEEIGELTGRFFQIH